MGDPGIEGPIGERGLPGEPGWIGEVGLPGKNLAALCFDLLEFDMLISKFFFYQVLLEKKVRLAIESQRQSSWSRELKVIVAIEDQSERKAWLVRQESQDSKDLKVEINSEICFWNQNTIRLLLFEISQVSKVI